MIFGVDHSLSSHTENLKNNFLGEGDTFGINGSFVHQKFDINFSKAKNKSCLSLHYNNNNSYLFKANNKSDNFPSHFCLGSESNKSDFSDEKEVFLKRNVFDFLINLAF